MSRQSRYQKTSLRRGVLLPTLSTAIAFLSPVCLADELQDVVEETVHQRQLANPKVPSNKHKIGTDFFADQIWDPDGHFTLSQYMKMKGSDPSVWEKETKEIFERNILEPEAWKFTSACPAKESEKEGVFLGEKFRYFSVKVEKRPPPLNVEDVHFENAIMYPIGTSSSCHFGFWARAKEFGQMHVTVALTKAPYDGVFNHTVILTTDWRYYSCTAELPPIKAGEYSVKFYLGSGANTVDIRNNIYLKLNDSKSLSNEQIDAHRTGKVSVVVRDKDNKPVKNARINLNQTRHDFQFGSTLFDFDPVSHSATQRNIQSNFKQLFNVGFIPIYWNAYEPVEGKADYSRIEQLTKWCKANQVGAIGRTLLSSPSYPAWAPVDPVKASSVIKAHISGMVGKVGDSFWAIELTDDLMRSLQNRTPNGVTNWIRSLPTTTNAPEGKAAVALQRLIVMAREANHNTKTKSIWFCDDWSPHLESFLEYKKSFGSMPDAVALEIVIDANLQPHVVSGLLARLAPFKVPVYLYLYSPANLKSSRDNPLFDRTHTALEIYRVAFSHKNLNGIIWDGLIDHSPAPADFYGLLRSDGTPKPIYNELANLIRKDWWTKADGTTDDTGTYSTKAFFGEYLLSIKLASGQTITKTFNFQKNAERSQTITIHI
jgi:endo-1,4-beta-xylanase